MALEHRYEGMDTGDPLRWWTAIPEKVANALTAAAGWIESMNWRRRYMSFLCARMMSGRDTPGSFGLAISSRGSKQMQSTWGAQFNPPALNVIATSADVLANKVYAGRPWLEWIPNRGDFKSRMASKGISEYTDAAFDETEFWKTWEMCRWDAMTYGTGISRVDMGFNEHLDITRVCPDEILLPPDSAMGHKPRSMIQAVPVSRDEAIEYVNRLKHKTAEEKELLKAKIKNAAVAGCYPGFYEAPIKYSDVVWLIEGWSLPVGDLPGRHVLAIDSLSLVDEKWERTRFPFAKMVYQPVAGQWFGQGLAEITMPLQLKIDRETMAIDEIERRDAWPRYTYESSSMVNPEHFNGPGLIPFSGPVRPMALEYAAASSLRERYAERDSLIQRAFQRNGISPNQSAGETPGGLTSGRALLAYNQIDDSRHKTLGQRDEDGIFDVGNLLVDFAEAHNPKFMIGHKQMDWKMVGVERTRGKLKPFPMSRLPTLPAARIQVIQDWYNRGKISHQTEMRLQDMPDTQGFVDQFTASERMIHMQLDKIVQFGKFEPPDPISDLKQALALAQARYMQEVVDELPEDRLRVIVQYIEAVQEMSPPESSAPPQPGIGAGQPVATPPGGAPQITPDMMPPAAPTGAPAPVQMAA